MEYAISERESIDISKLPTGVYLVNLAHNGKFYRQSFMKKQ